MHGACPSFFFFQLRTHSRPRLAASAIDFGDMEDAATPVAADGEQTSEAFDPLLAAKQAALRLVDSGGDLPTPPQGSQVNQGLEEEEPVALWRPGSAAEVQLQQQDDGRQEVEQGVAGEAEAPAVESAGPAPTAATSLHNPGLDQQPVAQQQTQQQSEAAAPACTPDDQQRAADPASGNGDGGPEVQPPQAWLEPSDSAAGPPAAANATAAATDGAQATAADGAGASAGAGTEGDAAAAEATAAGASGAQQQAPAYTAEQWAAAGYDPSAYAAYMASYYAAADPYGAAAAAYYGAYGAYYGYGYAGGCPPPWQHPLCSLTETTLLAAAHSTRGGARCAVAGGRAPCHACAGRAVRLAGPGQRPACPQFPAVRWW